MRESELTQYRERLNAVKQECTRLGAICDSVDIVAKRRSQEQQTVQTSLKSLEEMLDSKTQPLGDWQPALQLLTEIRAKLPLLRASAQQDSSDYRTLENSIQGDVKRVRDQNREYDTTLAQAAASLEKMRAEFQKLQEELTARLNDPHISYGSDLSTLRNDVIRWSDSTGRINAKTLKQFQERLTEGNAILRRVRPRADEIKLRHDKVTARERQVEDVQRDAYENLQRAQAVRKECAEWNSDAWPDSSVC
jgi:chromosome segregation ATPase